MTLLERFHPLSQDANPTINFRGINTSIMNKVRNHRVNNFVTCLCSSRTVEKLLQQMKNADARDLKAGINKTPTQRKVTMHH